MKLVLGIATAGRRMQMALTLRQVANQDTLPLKIAVCPADSQDFDQADAALVACPIEVVTGTRGLCAQRNAILDASGDADILVFFDDDFYPARDYLSKVTEIFEQHPDVVIVTNQPVADGVSGPGISHEDAENIINSLPESSTDTRVDDTYGGYGCNFSVRLAVLRRNSLRFDEELPLYGWLEDIEFSRRAAPHGRIVNFRALRGVHLGTKKGRISGVRFGYSQIANPIYMVRKGSLSTSYATKHIVKHMIKNFTLSLNPEPWVDRRGRLKGNLMAWLDFARGKLSPGQILKL